MYIICCHDKYTSKARRLTSRENLYDAKNVATSLRKVYRHVTVHEESTGKILFQRKDRDCCKVEKVEFA